jgi:hypothetical protein
MAPEVAMRVRTLQRCLMVLSLIGSPWLWADHVVVRYPMPETAFDKRTEYPLKLLELALAKSGQPFRLMPTPQAMNQGRALHQLKSARGVDVVWSMTSVQRERDLLPVRIPIYKGLIGWRVFLINRQDAALFDRPMTLAQLRAHIMVQGHDWPDTRILQMNGFTVMGTPSYQAIFDMLLRRRAELFPRSIVEVWGELESHGDKGIALEQTKLLHYPTAFYYFVAPNNRVLAERIEQGLNLAIADGSVDHLFMHYHAELLSKARLDQRQVYPLDNPILPAATPLQRRELWYPGY